MHTRLGHYFGEKINAFIALNAIEEQIDFIASHGHTIFHFPKQRFFTTQIGDGAQIAAVTGLPTIVDFGSKDVALHGNGAPVVAIGEKYLFGANKLFLNVGGIANVSYHQNSSIVGFDVCCANQLLNHLAGKMDKPYDEFGAIASFRYSATRSFDTTECRSVFRVAFSEVFERIGITKACSFLSLIPMLVQLLISWLHVANILLCN